MEAELKKNFDDMEVELIAGGGGIFDVSFGGQVLFSKNRADCGSRFPDQEEITKSIREAM